MIFIEDIETDLESEEELEGQEQQENICQKCQGYYIVKTVGYEDIEAYGYIDRIPIYGNVCEDCGYVETDD